MSSARRNLNEALNFIASTPSGHALIDKALPRLRNGDLVIGWVTAEKMRTLSTRQHPTVSAGICLRKAPGRHTLLFLKDLSVGDFLFTLHEELEHSQDENWEPLLAELKAREQLMREQFREKCPKLVPAESQTPEYQELLEHLFHLSPEGKNLRLFAQRIVLELEKHAKKQGQRLYQELTQWQRDRLTLYSGYSAHYLPMPAVPVSDQQIAAQYGLDPAVLRPEIPYSSTDHDSFPRPGLTPRACADALLSDPGPEEKN